MLETVTTFLQTGGWVMWPLTLLGMGLWFLLALRFQLLKTSNRSVTEQLNPLLCESGKSSGVGIVGYVINAGSDLVLRFIDDSQKAGKAIAYFDGSFLLLIKQADRVLERYRSGIRMVCAVAPLLGLLGTVSGMVETFSSLTGLQAYVGDNTMAGGISTALISTQMGLLVAIPGVIMGRMLDRREDVLRTQLLQVGEELQRFKTSSLEALS